MQPSKHLRNFSERHLEAWHGIFQGHGSAAEGCVGGLASIPAQMPLRFVGVWGILWVVPFLSGIPFGMGYLLIFMAMLNYLTDAY